MSSYPFSDVKNVAMHEAMRQCFREISSCNARASKKTEKISFGTFQIDVGYGKMELNLIENMMRENQREVKFQPKCSAV